MMKNFINLIREQNFTEAEQEIDSLIPVIMEKKILEMKKAVAAKMYEQMGVVGPTTSDKRKTDVLENKEEAEEKEDDESEEDEDKEKIDEARVKIVKARIRGGKIQRRKKVSNVPGMTLRGGQLKRMSAAERRRRKLGARKGKMKRRAKLSRSLMKRKRSMQRRKSLGL